MVLADLKLILNTVAVIYSSFAQTSANQKSHFSLFRVAIVICSGNLELHLLQQCIARALTLDNRLCRFSVVLSDSPGDISKLLEILAGEETR